MLPQRALTLIREYSKPITRPDWKTLNIMSYDYYYSILHNSKENAVLRKFIINKCPVYTIDNLPFIIKCGQTYLYRRVKYTIIDILPMYMTIIHDSCGNIYNGTIYLYYKDRLSNGELRRMEGVYIYSNNNKIYLDQTNYLIRS